MTAKVITKRLLIALPYICLVTILFLLHFDVFFNGHTRLHGDHTRLHFSLFYFLDGLFSDGELPLWQPYRSFGVLNIDALCFFNPLLIILSKLYLVVAEISGLNTHSMYQVTFLSYLTGYILTFVLPCWLISKELTKNTFLHWISAFLAMFGSHLFIMIYEGKDLLFYFPFVLLFWIRLIDPLGKQNIVSNFAGLFVAICLTLSNSSPGFLNQIVAVYIVIGLCAMLTSLEPWFGLPGFFRNFRMSYFSSPIKSFWILTTCLAVGAGLATIRWAIFLRIGEFGVKNRSIAQSKPLFLSEISKDYIYTNPLSSIVENLLNPISFQSETQLVLGLPYPTLYLGIISIILLMVVFKKIVNRRSFLFLFTATAFLLLCTTNPTKGGNIILPFSYLFNPFFTMGTRHVNIIILFASPVAILSMIIVFNTFLKRYTYFAYQRHIKWFVFFICATFFSFLVYVNVEGYYPNLYLYWYTGGILLAVTMVLYIPRSKIIKPQITIPLVLTVILFVEIMIPLKNYQKIFYQPFLQKDHEIIKKIIIENRQLRGLPFPLRHSFPQKRSAANQNITRNIYHKMNNAYFKSFYIDGFNDATFYPKKHNIDQLPWLKHFKEHLVFIQDIVLVNDQKTAMKYAEVLAKAEKHLQLAVVEKTSELSELNDLYVHQVSSIEELMNLQTNGVKKTIVQEETELSTKNFRYIGKDASNKKSSIYSGSLPFEFPAYLTTNFYNSDYSNIHVQAGTTELKPTYFDLFPNPSLFQVGFRDKQIQISSVKTLPDSIILRWRDWLKEHNIEIKKYTYNKLIFTTSANENRFMVYLDRFDPHWKLVIDGQRHKIYKTNGIFKGLYLPKGVHEVSLEYSDPVLTYSFSIFSFSLFMACLMILYLYRLGRFESPIHFKKTK